MLNLVSQFNKDQVFTELKEREYAMSPQDLKDHFENDFIILKFNRKIAESFNFFKLGDHLQSLIKKNTKEFGVPGILQI